MNRLCDIVEYANAYNVAMSATAATVGAQTPIYRSILATEHLPHTFHYLRRNIRLVNLHAVWHHTFAAAWPIGMDADGRDIAKYLRLPPRGVTIISLAKRLSATMPGYHTISSATTFAARRFRPRSL